MTVTVRLAVEAEEFVLGRVFSETTSRIELTQFVPVGERFAPYFWKECVGDRAGFERSVRDHSAVAELVDLGSRANERLYRIGLAGESDGFLDALCVRDVLVTQAFTNAGTRWLFRLRAADRSELSAFQAACSDHGIRPDVRRLHHRSTDVDRRGTLVGVTAKQAEAILLALERGYFQVPRGSSATELGAELGISRPSFSRRLQRGQQAIFTNLRSDLHGL